MNTVPNVNLAGRGGVTLLAVAAYRGNDTIAEALLARGADDRATDETGKSPIIYAAAAGWFDVVTLLLARNVDINARYANDLTLLMWASGPDESAPGASGDQGRQAIARPRRAYR